MMLPRSWISTLALATLLPGQNSSATAPTKSGELATGWCLTRLAQATPSAPKLAAVVCYPRKASKPAEEHQLDAEIALRKGGYPVLVFLHGLGGSGGQMMAIGRHFARHGYIAVLTDTTRFNRSEQAQNGHAFFAALKSANADQNSFLYGQLDLNRAGIGGHSMGGGNSVKILADNPGYKAGFCFAPWTTHIRRKSGPDYVERYGAKITVPLGVLHGVRDRVLDWEDNALRLFHATKADKALKVLWVLDDSASHINIAIARRSSSRNRVVLERCLTTATAFFDAFLKDETAQLATLLDPKAKPTGVLALHVNTKDWKPKSKPSKQSAQTTAAPVGQHWAYQAPKRPTPPAISDPWIQNPIDAFVLSRLRTAGRQPSEAAAKTQVLRRVYLDLTGLPPPLEVVDQFLLDPSPSAYHRIVDQLLASPRFGEHWARHWLDLARYADSNGFQADQLRDSWAYRDWVIDALNQGMPFDTFTIQQIAGDLIANPTAASRIATGFHRTVTCNVEAGVHPEANRVNQVVDRVNTTATVWLGSTLACAQCHDHKYDPLSQQEYFKFFAFFNNTPIEVRNPGGKGVSFDFYGPKMDLPLRADQQTRRSAIEAQLKIARARQVKVTARADPAFQSWRQQMTSSLAKSTEFETLRAQHFESTGDEEVQILNDGSILLGGRVPSTASYTVEVDTEMTGITAFRIEVLTDPSLPGTGPGRGDEKRPNFILSEFTITAHPQTTGNGAANSAKEPIQLHDAHADYSQNNWPVSGAIDGDPRKGWAIAGAFFKNHWATFATRRPVGFEGGTHLTFTLDQNFGRGRTIGRFRLSAFRGDPATLRLPPTITAILLKKKTKPGDIRQLRQHFLNKHTAAKKSAGRIRELQKQRNGVKPATTLVMVENDTPRKTHVMRRGDYMSPGEEVLAATPAVLHPFDSKWPKNRLGLAQWLVSPDNPLVARVTANRLWSQIFGQGIVVTEEDFGLRSQPPSHPQLLDWLAVEFVDSGWSIKKLLRTIVTSATYQQNSRRAPHDPDPHNRLYGRGPRFRLSAEAIRDNALAVAGLLSHNTGGPPVYPPQPPGLWRQTGRNEPKYVTSKGPERFRRGVYVVWRRAAPYPSFVLFDGPDRASCHPMRSRTNTPMQALTLMNDAAFLEAAAGLAARILKERPGATVEQGVEHAFRLTLARLPRSEESKHLVQTYQHELKRLQAQPKLAEELLKSLSAVALPANATRIEVAAWFHVATILLNLDETITKG
jgi:dienelactone hydrolase